MESTGLTPGNPALKASTEQSIARVIIEPTPIPMTPGSVQVGVTLLSVGVCRPSTYRKALLGQPPGRGPHVRNVPMLHVWGLDWSIETCKDGS